MYKPPVDGATPPVAEPFSTPAVAEPFSTPAVNSAASSSYSTSNQALLQTHVVIPPQSCQVAVQMILVILVMFMGMVVFGLELLSWAQQPLKDEFHNYDYIPGLGLGPASLAFVIGCIAIAILCQTVAVSRYGQNALDLNSSLSCQVTMLTTALVCSMVVYTFCSFWVFITDNSNTTAGVVYGGLLGGMALLNFVASILGCCATCSSSCGGCCNCQACCVSGPHDYRAQRPNQLAAGGFTSSMQSYGTYQTTPH